ncbi:MAG TPA: hypothetical protein PLF81_06665 [Candidatus Anammoximicrobium sp.]|nr:hypothetical protein [Candidatus Anammoximicrobium sp.]
MTGFPPEFSVATSPGPTRYVLADGYFAVPDSVATAANLDIEFRLEDDGLCVCRGVPGSEPASDASGGSTPVYRIGQRGPLAVPTGRVFVRFEQPTSLSSRREEIQRAGFVIQQSLSYAPHAGWVAPQSGRIADALERFPNLRQLAGVQAVEPQMLMPAQRR